jgi:hypothetical protein
VSLRLDGSNGVLATSGPKSSGLRAADRRLSSDRSWAGLRGPDRRLSDRISAGSDWLRLQHDRALGLVHRAQLVKPQLHRIGKTEK